MRSSKNRIVHILLLLSFTTMFRTSLSLQTWSGIAIPKVSIPRNNIRVVQRSFSYKRSKIVMMPEGPEVRTLVDQLQPAVGMRLVDFKFLSGRYVKNGRPNGFEDFARTMTPTQVDDNNESTDNDNIDVVSTLNCKGKFIYLVLDQGRQNDNNVTENYAEDDYQRSIWITLGMTGQFANDKEVENPKPLASNSDKERSGPRWYIELMDTQTKETRRIYYRDARNFGTLRFSLSASELNEKLASLGPDLLDFKTTTEEVFLAAMEKSTQTRNICKFLMDQSKIAGVGNYILAEGLYRSRLDPWADLSEISVGQRKRLFKELRDVIDTSYKAQGLTRPEGGTFRGVDGDKGQFEFQLQCYGQRLSPNKYPITKDVDGPHGRTIWYSEEEQLFMPRSQRMMKDNDNDDGKEDLEYSVSSNANESKYVFSEITNQLHDKGWKRALSEHMESESFQSLLTKLQNDADSGETIYPPPQDVFSALNLCPLESVKVVIVGQDPYHNPNQGHGLAFSVRKGVKPPPSLRNIFKEAMDDVGIEDPKNNGSLEGWAKQGVLLLNTVLTVRRNEPQSHVRMGWEEFTDEVINTINEQKDSVVFLLWGGPAAKKAKKVNETKHTVIRTSHPSPLGATKTASPFLSSRCFSRANDALIQNGKDPIDWNVR